MQQKCLIVCQHKISLGDIARTVPPSNNQGFELFFGNSLNSWAYELYGTIAIVLSYSKYFCYSLKRSFLCIGDTQRALYATRRGCSCSWRWCRPSPRRRRRRSTAPRPASTSTEVRRSKRLSQERKSWGDTKNIIK